MCLLYRGTIRKVGFSKAWNMFVQLGMTDDSYIMEKLETMSYRDFVNSFLPYHPTDSVEIKTRLILKLIKMISCGIVIRTGLV
jgi:hypothetical protein